MAETGTPLARAAVGSPPAAKIQLPILVRQSTQLAITVKPAHQKRETRKSSGGVPKAVARTALRESKPGASSRRSIRASPVKYLDKATFAPRRPKKVPRVMMKEASPVRTTRMPFQRPRARQMRSERSAASQMLMPHSTAMMPSAVPAVATMTPAERSYSPPIMSRPTATAMMP